jgi:hypothetical protein
MYDYMRALTGIPPCEATMQTFKTGGFEIGDSVSFSLGGRRVEGLVVEDRGPLAGGGRHLYRVLVSFPPEDPASFEMPEDELARHGARRALFAEVANRVLQNWWSTPAGPPR